MTPRVLVAQFGCLIPLLVLIVYRLRGRILPGAFWLVAYGFVVSLVADIIADATGGSWIAVPWYMIPQFLLFGFAMLADGARPMIAPVLVYLALGGIFWLGMMQHRSDPAPYTYFMAWWYPYQLTRLASFGLFVRAAWRR